MKPNYTPNDTAPITFGELCEALAEDELPATIKDGFYVVRQGDLRHFMRTPQDFAPMLLELLNREPAQIAS